MDLLDRYLRTVRSALPTQTRDDIARELGENLRDRIDDRVDELGRPLTEAELLGLLAAFGHPLEIASRFRPDQRSVAFGRQLIGPVVFPVYLRVLTIALPLATGGALLGVLLDRDAWSLGVAAGRLALPLALSFLAITVIFTVIDRYAARHPMAWDPDTEVPLPGLFADGGWTGGWTGAARSRLQSTLGALGELVVAVVGAALWLAFRPWTSVDGLTAGPAWSEPWPWLVLPIALSLLAPVVTIVTPARQTLAGTLRITADGLLVVLALWSLSLGTWLVADPVSAAADQARLTELVNGAAAVTLAATAIVSGWSIATELLKLRRQRTVMMAAI